MICWCKLCGAYMGARPPLGDYSADYGGICIVCAGKQMEEKEPQKEDEAPKEKPTETT
jgi:hypothetical protein